MKFIKRTKINVPVEKLFSWHARRGAIERLTPSWVPMQLVCRNMDGIEKGVRVKFKINLLKIPVIWESEHIEYVENHKFKDRQIRGPFAKWEHTHRFLSDGLESSIMEDEIDFELPFGVLSKPFYKFALKEMQRMFHYRHRVLKYDLEHGTGKTGSLRILVSGGSGTIGKALIPLLQTSGHEVIKLVRRKKIEDNELFWDPYNDILDIEKAGKIDAVINLNGVDISKGKWTAKQKKLIMDSRVIPTRVLADKIRDMSDRPEVFISASAIGFYGDSNERFLTETDPMGHQFISKICNEWERAGSEADTAGVRTVFLRTGVVLTPRGGALAKMLLPFKLGLGVILSKGRQYISWISMDDEIAAIRFILENNRIEGPVNLTAPQPLSNREFSKILGSVFSRRVLFKMPALMIKLIWGQMGKETILASTRVKPVKLLNSGFVFQHKTLVPALKDLLGR